LQYLAPKPELVPAISVTEGLVMIQAAHTVSMTAGIAKTFKLRATEEKYFDAVMHLFEMHHAPQDWTPHTKTYVRVCVCVCVCVCVRVCVCVCVCQLYIFTLGVY
jgi:hypothetical protein